MFIPIFFKHPLTKEEPLRAIWRYCKWHLLKLFKKNQFVYNLIGETKIYVTGSDNAALVNYYTGLYEFEEMCFLLHFITSKDLLIDAGANIGVFSLLASGHRGSQSIAFEPIPTTFDHLKANIRLNNLQEKIHAHNFGLASSNGKLKFTKNLENSINRVADISDVDVIEVEVKKLDDVVTNIKKYEMILLKVDVEGFEAEVLKGGSQILSNPKLKALIIELNGSGKKFGFNEEEIKSDLENLGFNLCYYNPFTRMLSKEAHKTNWGNAIYVRDIDFVLNRLSTAKAIEILGKKI